MDISSGVNLETAYWVFFQWFHEKSISKDQSAILRHLGLLLWAKGDERERKQMRRIISRFGQDSYILLIKERGDSLILPFRISIYHSKHLVYYSDFREFDYHMAGRH